MEDSGSTDRIVHEASRSPGQSKATKDEVNEAAREKRLRRLIMAACLDMGRLGLTQGTSGNISARCGPHMLITPSATPYEELRPNMIVRAHLDANERSVENGLRASSEWRLHRDVLRARPEIGAVVHFHAAHATALSMLRRPLPAVHYMIALFGGHDVRCAPYAPFGSQELSDAAVEALNGRTAALLGAHGALALGGDSKAAMRNAEELETLARMYCLARAVGAPVELTPDQVSDAIARFADYLGPE